MSKIEEVDGCRPCPNCGKQLHSCQGYCAAPGVVDELLEKEKEAELAEANKT